MATQSAGSAQPLVPAHPDDRFAVVVSRYNSEITNRLRDGAVATFREAGVAESRIRVEYVPGSFELPLAALALAKAGHYAGVVCLGAVIQGETTHHDYINHQVAAGI